MLVEIYGMDNCTFCEKAKELANKYELPMEYKELDVDFNYQDFLRLFPDSVSFPQIVINDDHIGGYSDFKEVMEIACE